MKVLLALGIIALASGACDAATPAYSDFDVVSVIPRSPNVKPFVMSISAKDQQKHAEAPKTGPVVTGR